MTAIYLIVALIINATEASARFIEGINICFNSNMSGIAIFWWGLLIAFVIDLITG